MTTPALQRLREKYPAAEITLLTAGKLAGLWASDPSVNQIVEFAPRESPWAISRRLKPYRHDLGLIFPNSPRSALELWLAGIPERVGFTAPWRNWFLTRAIGRAPDRVRMVKRRPSEARALAAGGVEHRTPPSPRAHQICEYLHLAGAVGAQVTPLPPRLYVSREEATAVADQLLGAYPPLPGGLLLGMNPGAEYGPAKRWPADRFASVAREVSRHMPESRWLVFGGPADRELCGQIAAQAGSGVLNLAGQTSLRQLLCLLKLCRALVTNDTGPMHVAAALGTQVVALFGSTSPALTGPGLLGVGGHHLITGAAPCAPCFLRTCPIDFRCMTSISIDQVVQTMLSTCRSG